MLVFPTIGSLTFTSLNGPKSATNETEVTPTYSFSLRLMLSSFDLTNTAFSPPLTR